MQPSTSPSQFPQSTISWGLYRQSASQTFMTADVNWMGATYSVTWRKNGLVTENEAKAAIKSKVQELYILKVRYLDDPATNKIVWNGANQITAFKGGTEKKKDLGLQWRFYKEDEYRQETDRLNKELIDISNKIAEAKAKNPPESTADFEKIKIQLEAKRTKKTAGRSRKETAQKLYDLHIRQRPLEEFELSRGPSLSSPLSKPSAPSSPPPTMDKPSPTPSPLPPLPSAPQIKEPSSKPPSKPSAKHSGKVKPSAKEVTEEEKKAKEKKDRELELDEMEDEFVTSIPPSAPQIRGFPSKPMSQVPRKEERDKELKDFAAEMASVKPPRSKPLPKPPQAKLPPSPPPNPSKADLSKILGELGTDEV